MVDWKSGTNSGRIKNCWRNHNMKCINHWGQICRAFNNENLANGVTPNRINSNERSCVVSYIRVSTHERNHYYRHKEDGKK